MPQTRKYDSNRARQRAYRSRQAKTRQQELADRGLPSLPSVASMPGHARWNAAIMRSLELLTMVRDEMSAYFDDRSETWQESDRGTTHEERVEALTELLDTLEEFNS